MTLIIVGALAALAAAQAQAQPTIVQDLGGCKAKPLLCNGAFEIERCHGHYKESDARLALCIKAGGYNNWLYEQELIHREAELKWQAQVEAARQASVERMRREQAEKKQAGGWAGGSSKRKAEATKIVTPDPAKLAAFEQRAKQAAAKLLKDPSSAIFKNVWTTFDGKYFVTCGEINGGNGLGGIAATSRFVVAQKKRTVRAISDGVIHSDWSEYCQ